MAEKKVITKEQVQADFDNAVEEYCEMLTEEAREGFNSELESFEAYKEKMKKEVRENIGDFRTRFQHGYEVLLEQIKTWPSESDKQMNQGGPQQGIIKP